MQELNLADLIQTKHNLAGYQGQEQSQLPEGNALSTALNMVHLPTEIASINEMGEVIDSLDKLPIL